MNRTLISELLESSDEVARASLAGDSLIAEMAKNKTDAILLKLGKEELAFLRSFSHDGAGARAMLEINAKIRIQLGSL